MANPGQEKKARRNIKANGGGAKRSACRFRAGDFVLSLFLPLRLPEGWKCMPTWHRGPATVTLMQPGHGRHQSNLRNWAPSWRTRQVCISPHWLLRLSTVTARFSTPPPQVDGLSSSVMLCAPTAVPHCHQWSIALPRRCDSCPPSRCVLR